MMRRMIPAMVLALAATWAVAQERQPADQMQNKKEMTATVVSADATVKTITVRTAPGEQAKTLPVAESAVASLKSVKAGEKVKLVLTTDPSSREESVTKIEKADTPPSQ